MTPLRESRSWTLRYEENKDFMIEPLRRYYLIFEGSYTEVRYFEGILNNRKTLGINNFVELIILHKEGELETHSNPKRLLELVNLKKEELKTANIYDEDIDNFVIVFDSDSFKTSEEYIEYVNIAKTKNILAVTSPCFEIWLMLHYKDSVNNIILNRQNEILSNQRVSNKHTFVSKLFSNISGMNPKSNLQFNQLQEKIPLAIQQEKLISQDVLEMACQIGSNIGLFLEELMKDPRDLLM